ncbi:MAG: DEAD/DEAH box helicase [Flavobacteriales bacterium]|nr:MAG: DEAD/DEAH box helicase [Flavobacteriales bacterium]
MNIHDLNLSPSLSEGLDAMRFEKATPIQEQAIPVIRGGKDLIACAQTGTGKTAAYLIPVIDKMVRENKRGQTKALVLVPTRELALQVDQSVEALSYFTEIGSIAVFGGGDGVDFERQRRAMDNGAEVVVATPGRLISILKASSKGKYFSHLEYLILDEADRMLDMGFHQDILTIISFLPNERQNLLFSATMPPNIRKLAKEIMHNPSEISLSIAKPAEKIKQSAYAVLPEQKDKLLDTLLSNTQYQSIIIFCSTKSSTSKLGSRMKKKGYSVASFSSDIEQGDRERIMLDFKSRMLNMLVGTDILARGIDVDGIELVVNYDLPSDADDYVHRIGRTARAERDGTAITFVEPRDMRKFSRIYDMVDKRIALETVPSEIGEAIEFRLDEKRGPSNGKSSSSNNRRFSGPKSNRSQNKKRPPSADGRSNS